MGIAREPVQACDGSAWPCAGGTSQARRPAGGGCRTWPRSPPPRTLGAAQDFKPTDQTVGTTVNSVSDQEVGNRQEVQFLPRRQGVVKKNELLTSAATWSRQQCEAEGDENDASITLAPRRFLLGRPSRHHLFHAFSSGSRRGSGSLLSSLRNRGLFFAFLAIVISSS